MVEKDWRYIWRTVKSLCSNWHFKKTSLPLANRKDILKEMGSGIHSKYNLNNQNLNNMTNKHISHFHPKNNKKQRRKQWTIKEKAVLTRKLFLSLVTFYTNLHHKQFKKINILNGICGWVFISFIITLYSWTIKVDSIGNHISRPGSTDSTSFCGFCTHFAP